MGQRTRLGLIVVAVFGILAWSGDRVPHGPTAAASASSPLGAPDRSAAPVAAASLASRAEAHDHDGLPSHSHAAPADPASGVPGRRLEISLGGGAIKSYFVIDEVLVGFRADPGTREVQTLLARNFLSIVRHEPELGALVLRHDGRERLEPVIERLRAAPQVLWVEPNHVAAANEACDHSPWFPGEGPLAKHNAKVLARCGFTVGAQTKDLPAGTGPIVAVLDTGVDATHPDLAGSVLAGRDFVNGDGDARDDSGHGTAMAGLISARVEGDWGVAGVAPGCRILPVKVCDRTGKAGVGDVASGIVWAVGQGARVISVSLGARRRSHMLEAAVRFAHARGAVVVAAAGNDHANQSHHPAACDGVIAVGALDDEGRVSAVTNLCARIDAYAPGEKLIVALPGGAFGLSSGTSTAAALVSGSVARLLALDPGLSPAQVRARIRTATRPVEAIAALPALAGSGRLDLDALLARAAQPGPSMRLVDVRTIPARPRAGRTARIEAVIENAGPGEGPAPILTMAGGVAPVPTAPERPVAEGESATYTWDWTPARAGIGLGTVRIANEERRFDVTVADESEVLAELRPVGFEVVDDPAGGAGAGTVRFVVALRNTGNVPVADLALEAAVDGVPLASPTSSEPIALGEVRRVELVWTVGEETAGGLHALRMTAGADGFERTWTWHFALGHRHDGRDVEVQWQQAGGVDIIADAPTRLVPGRPWLPLLFFVPSRGTAAPGPSLRLDHVTVSVKDTPTPGAPGTVIYEDASAPYGVVEPAVAVPGLAMVDEEGTLLTGPGGAPDLNLFHDEALVLNGRHSILRVPREAFGIPATPTAAMDKYLQVDVHWVYTAIAGETVTIKEGTQKWTLRVTFTSAAMPTLPGEGHYFDTHVHTIAEWHQSPAPETEPFAPSKAYGGPIQMLREAAWAVGLIEDPAETVNTVITSDHNNFHADPTPAFADPDSPLHRPPFGPTSPASSVAPDGTVKSEFARMRELFGFAAGEEITISQETYYAGYAIPLGAHMLSYRAQQFPGTWHGGSGLASTLFAEPPPLLLDEVLHDMAKLAHPDNTGAFAYAAHPFSGGFGFDDHHLDQSIGITAPFRTADTVSPVTGSFVFKGLQLFNGRAPGAIPGEEIDFADANPFVHAGWSGGAGWDRTLQVGLRSWHEILSKTMSWAFVDAPSKKFVRKTYISAGSDAHGDFNFSTGRAAMLIPMPYTFSMNSGCFADAVSYVFSEGKAGATAGERALDALADGNHVATDGPVIRFTMDADGRFDSDALVWHDKASAHENADGRMGGGGTLDGEGTMLVRRGAPEVHFRYRYAGFPDYGSDDGAVKAIHVYRTADGEANPTYDRTYGGMPVPVIAKRGSLAAAGTDADLVEKIAAAEEGLPTKVSCYALGAFTGGDPQIAPIGPEERRCYTNPVWAIPYDAEVVVHAIDAVGKKIDPGKLEVRFSFDLSMMPLPYAVGVKKLSAAGTSSGKTVPPLSPCSPLGLWGSNLATGAAYAKFSVTNDLAIPLSGDEYPTAGKYTFVVYFLEPVKDVNGNALHSIATTFSVDKPATPPPAKKCFVAATTGAPAWAGAGAMAWGVGLAALAGILAGWRPRRR